MIFFIVWHQHQHTTLSPLAFKCLLADFTPDWSSGPQSTMPTGRHETLHLTLGSGKPPEPIICRNFILVNMFKMTLQQLCHQVIMQVPSRAEGVIGENRTWEILHSYQPNDENELKTYCLENLMREWTCIRCGKTLTLKIQTVKNACKVQPKLNVMSQEMSKMDIRCL